MANPKAHGRMIRKDIADSEKFAALSPEAAVLFVMLIPHLNPWGKMNGGPGYIKDEICPLIPYLTYENIPGLLAEIDAKTNVKWFQTKGRQWLHALHFLTEHQNLDVEKLGENRLPDYPGVSPELVPTKSGVSPELVPTKSGVSPELVPDKSGVSPELVPDKSGVSPSPKTKTITITNENQKCGRAVEDELQDNPPEDLSALAEHSWFRFRGRFPTRAGKWQDEDACRTKWAKTPAMWTTWNACVDNYLASRDVLAGFPCTPMTFLARRWRDYLTPEMPTGQGPPPGALDTSWRDERAADEATAREERRRIEAGEVPARPRDRLPFEDAEEYAAKLAAGKVPLVPAEIPAAEGGR